jgi:hypothetical protein
MDELGKLTVAVMQPHFIPFAGYMRLFAAVDLFVIYDCVQFTRRGRIHRNQLPDFQGKARWLSLPLKKEDMTVSIKDLSFQSDASEVLKNNMKAFPCFENPNIQPELIEMILGVEGSPVDYNSNILAAICKLLKLPFNVIKSSSLGIDPNLTGQFRVLEILRQVGATGYVNSPGGRHLYDVEEFESRDIKIQFQAPYIGETWSILQRILSEDVSALGADIQRQA